MSTEQNTENGNWVPWVQPPFTCGPACAHGEDGTEPEQACNYRGPIWQDDPEPPRAVTGFCEDGYGHGTRREAAPGSRLCWGCIEDGWDNRCEICGVPGGGRGPGGYCSTICEEQASW